jgi:hypothetical protein
VDEQPRHDGRMRGVGIFLERWGQVLRRSGSRVRMRVTGWTPMAYHYSP